MSGYRKNLPAPFGCRVDEGQPLVVALEDMGTAVGSVWSIGQGSSATLGVAHIPQGWLTNSAKQTIASFSRAGELPATNQARGVQCKGALCN